MEELKTWLASSRVPGFQAETQQPLLERHLRWLDHPAHHFLCLGSPGYPPLLANLPDAPAGLLVRGDPNVLSLPQLAIVGSRNPTQAGYDIARQFAAQLARSGLTITSGLAIGIDTARAPGRARGRRQNHRRVRHGP